MVAVLLTFAVVPAAAQTNTVTSLPRVFVGMGFAASSNDAASRMRLYEKGQATTWLAEGGVRLTPRTAIGAEYSQVSPAVASTTVGAGRLQISGRQEERVLAGTLRVRLAASPRLAFDAVGGGGAVFQRHDTGTCAPPADQCATNGPHVRHRAPAFVAGIDLPVAVAGHFAVTPQVRVYVLHRGEHTSEEEPSLPWQYEWKSSSRVVFGVGARAFW